jgi:lipopolysaccharide export system permease protein
MILARYLVRQFTPPFAFGLALFSGVLLLDKLFDIIDMLINKGVSFRTSAHIFLLFLPTVLTLTIPMAVLLACLLTFGRLSEDNEITALRASGLSFNQILWPPLLLAFLLSCGLVPFNTLVAPRAVGAFRNLYHRIVTSDPLIKIEPRQFISLHDIRLYARGLTPDRQEMKDVYLFQLQPDRWQRVFARSGTAEMDGDRFRLHLKDGQIDRLPTGLAGDLMHVRFARYDLAADAGAGPSARDLSLREMTVTQLRGEIRSRTKERQPTGPPEAELNLRIAISFSPLALALLGIPLGITLERGGRGVGFGASVGVVFAYYLLLIFGLNLAEKDVFPAVPALWAANAFTAAVGVVLYWRRVLK